MKKLVIGILVGSIILFVWQFLSWSMLGVHENEIQYTDKQEEILAALAAAGLEDGHYFLPRAPQGASQAEQQAVGQANAGKPWATISYHNALDSSMGMNMFRGWLVDLISVWLLVWVLLKISNLDFKTALLASLAVGLIGYFTLPYLNSIWFQGNSIGPLIDTVVQWGLCGSWLGWWLTR